MDAKQAIETRAMCPVVIAVVTSAPLGNLTMPQRIENASLFSGGVKVIIVTPGQIVQRTEMTKKLSIPIRAIIRRVARVNIEVSSLASPNIAFCVSILALDIAKSLASSRLAAAALASEIPAANPPTIFKSDPIPVAPSVVSNIVINPNIYLFIINHSLKRTYYF